jgi:hypothetical protein
MPTMKSERSSSKAPRQLEPRWPALVALLAIGGLHYALPSAFSFGPDWLLLAIIALLGIPTIVFHRIGRQRLTEILGYIIQSAATLEVAYSLTLLIARLPSHRDSPKSLLLSAAGLWASNVLIFASWYWRLDAGGPHKRALSESHTNGAFLFPQMTLTPAMRAECHGAGWKPGFVDYLFVAFNTSTAFSPTDVPVLSRWAKAMMMVQAAISLGTVAILAARAVNVL